ncbi:hypothetical protein DUI87_23716 [Hirundo rustica rustica]|uniref:ribonuclease H n=1 Tax=Hirundo rustica rustica TaxID=333673 RepID=A0A3M0JFW1_HIRRU|nr:hypothetical protein DUI87_23716 [Hirundo rustica rustica]
MAQGRRETWAALAQQGWQREDPELAAAAQEQIDTCAFPVIFQPNAQGGQRAELVNLDWKLLSQLRATVASYGVTSEPAKQMLEFLFNANLLLPSDIRGISKLIYTPHQRLLFEARWREEAAMSAALPRPQGDPLIGLTMDELMGQGPFHRIEAQVALGQEKLREAMAVARRVMGKIRAPGGTPIYMGIKQGRDEPLGSFVDKIIEALSKAAASLAPTGGKPYPYLDKGESDGAAMEPTDVKTVHVPAEPQGQSQPAAVSPVETKKTKVKSAHPGLGFLWNGYYKDPRGLRWAFGIAAMEAEGIKKLNTLLGLSENPSPIGLLKVEVQQVPVATSTVHHRQYQTNRDAVIPIHKMIHELETQGVVSKAHSPFNSPIRPVCKSDREWRLTVDYRGLNKVTPLLSAAVPDMLELQYELESKAAKWYTTIDIANAFFSVPLSAECRPQFAFT